MSTPDLQAMLTDADERLIFKLRKIFEEEDITELYFSAIDHKLIWNTTTSPQGHIYERKSAPVAIRSQVKERHG